jgi:hypothetical protein
LFLAQLGFFWRQISIKFFIRCWKNKLVYLWTGNILNKHFYPRAKL